jgi:TolB-like protein/Tfp pilus assembly protein PilF
VIGQTVSHYRITSQLGAGGMGVVYQAEDVRHGQTVALKFLPPELSRDPLAKRRFVEEARSAFAIDHPNICNVLELDETTDGRLFLAMTCYEGETLRERLRRGPLPVAEATDIAAQVARGLAAAHQQGVIHRDIKPANIFLTASGEAKILDFGLAKLVDRTQLTRTGGTLGTPAYMSPEQAQGKAVDARTDVWSLGVVLYEMLAGQAPFRGDTGQAVLYSILNTNPEPITRIRREVPVGLQDILDRALTKIPARRYQTVAELLSALETVQEESPQGSGRRSVALVKRLQRGRRLLATFLTVLVLAVGAILIVTFHERGQAIDSIAVLPLQELSGVEEQDYFADGVTGELISNLMGIGNLEKVSPHSAVMRYENTDKTLREIADELGVKGLVGGTIQRAGDQVRITAELTYAPTEKLLWSNIFDGKMENILALQSEIARAIAREIHVRLTPEEEQRLTETRTVDPEAYDVFLKGREICRNFDQLRFEEAVQYYQEAIEKDPEFAPAYAALAETYVWLGVAMGPGDYREIARAAALRAVELDASLPEAYQALGHVSYQLDFDWEVAERAYQRAAELRPGVAGNGEFYMLSGRFDEGIAIYQRRLELDPLDPWGPLRLGWAYLCARRFDDAIPCYQRSQKIFPGFNERMVTNHLAACYYAKGMFDEAFVQVEKLKPAPVDSQSTEEDLRVYNAQLATYRYKLNLAHAFAGHRDVVQKWIDEVGDRPEATDAIGELYAILGETDKALAQLEKAWEIEPENVIWLNVSFEFDRLIDDPRFIEFKQRIGIPPIQWSSAPPWSPQDSRAGIQ